MEPRDIETFVRDRHHATMVTLRASGAPQVSNVAYSYRDGAFRVSVTDDRAKTRNLRRDPRLTMHVTSTDFWSYVVADGLAELSPVTTVPGDETGRVLREVYEHVTGAPHPDWGEFDQAMVDQRRLVIRLRPDHVYGQLQP